MRFLPIASGRCIELKNKQSDISGYNTLDKGKYMALHNYNNGFSHNDIRSELHNQEEQKPYKQPNN